MTAPCRTTDAYGVPARDQAALKAFGNRCLQYMGFGSDTCAGRKEHNQYGRHRTYAGGHSRR